jgi:hypothetical protein
MPPLIIVVLVLIFVVAPLAKAVANRIEAADRRSPALPDAERERIERLEGRMSALAERVDEIAEHQEFLTRLLEGRSPGGRPALTEDGDR